MHENDKTFLYRITVFILMVLFVVFWLSALSNIRTARQVADERAAIANGHAVEVKP